MNQITTIEGMDGTEVEELFLKGELNHLKDQKVTSQQIMQMKRAKMFEMIKAGLIQGEISLTR